MTEPRQHSRARRFWDGHGSWVLLFAIAICSYQVGAQFTSASTARIIEVLVKANNEQVDSYRSRIRELHDRLENYAGDLKPVIQQAAADASEAADKATKASESATTAVDKAKSIEKPAK